MGEYEWAYGVHSELRTRSVASKKGGDEMMKRTTRRQLLVGAVSGTLTSLLLAACQTGRQEVTPTVQPQSTPPAGTTPSPVVTATPTPLLTPTVAPTPTTTAQRTAKTFRFAYLRFAIAGCGAIDELGLLQARGWNVEFMRIDQTPALVNAFASGQAQISDMATVVAAQMFEQGVPLKVFCAATGPIGAILVQKDSDIQSIPQLRGRKVGGIPGTNTMQDTNAMVRKLYSLDLISDTQFIQASSAPDAANLLINKNVEAIVIWQPTVANLLVNGHARILATQWDLWKQVSGRTAPPVHIIYYATPSLTTEYPDLLRDIVAAQKEVAELWRKGDERIVTAYSKVSGLPPEVIRSALTFQVPMWGLDKDLQDTILEQLRFNRESGVWLKSDIWLDPEKVRSEFFWVP